MIQLTVITTGPDQAASAAARLANPSGMHAAMAAASETFLKKFGRGTAPNHHITAKKLGATPTGHLEKAYSRIESSSNASSASLWIPGASRLRAAFGPYTVRPTGTRKYLTIPMTAEAYGKRAAEIPDVKPVRMVEKKALFLAKEIGGKEKPYYLLVKEATIPEDAGLIPFNDLYAEAAGAAEKYLLETEAAP